MADDAIIDADVLRSTVKSLCLICLLHIVSYNNSFDKKVNYTRLRQRGRYQCKLAQSGLKGKRVAPLSRHFKCY